MTPPMEGKLAQTIVENMSVPGWIGVYALGCIDHRVTLYSQQVRALNLAAALVTKGHVHPDEPVVVIGAGAAGLTCAAGLRQLGVDVIVLEQREKILPLFDGGSSRWLHPRVYDWPSDGWERGEAGLPLLDWKQGTVSEVRRQLLEGWNAARRGVESVLNVKEVTSIGASTDSPRTVFWAPGGEQPTRTLILAVGFGLEAERPRYWEGDDLDADPSDGRTRKWLVSGSGDGGLTDLLRLCIAGFRHDMMVEEFTKDPRMNEIRAKIREIEGNPTKVGKDDTTKVLHEDYRKLDAPWVQADMKKRRRHKNEVWLATETPSYLGGGASPLNRFLVSQLRKAGSFEVIPSRVVQDPPPTPEGNEVRVWFANKRSDVFDRIVVRHGPTPALRAGCLAEIDEALAGRRKDRRAMPISTDQTRERYWPEGVFGREARDAPRKSNSGSSAARPTAPVSPTSSQSPKDPELAHYLAKLESLHSELRLAGFETKVRVPIGLEELYEPLDAVLNRSARREQVFKTSEEAVGHDASIELAKAFEHAPGRGVVLLGDPGSGKTTHLKQVLLQVLRKGPKSIGLPAGTVPVFLPLRRLRNLDAGLPWFITQELRDPLLDVDAGFGERLCKRRKLLFLLDGLDEVANAEDRRRVARWIEEARRASRDNYFLVSCRFSGYTLDAQLDEGFVELHLRPMSPEQVERFVRKWYGIVERATHSDPAQAEVKAKTGANDLLATLRKPEMRSARVYTMTHNPLLLTTICLVHRDRGTLPDKRVVLYEEAVSVLLERWRRVTKDLEVTFPAREALQVLMPVAAWMHEKSGRIRAKATDLEAPVTQGLAAIGRANVPAQTFLETIRDESGLLTGWGVDEFGFMHLGFQEYLAALAIQVRVLDQPEVLERLAERFDESWWQEVILLALAQDRPPLFRRFMSGLVERSEFPKWARSELMGLCWGEAFGVSAEPFVELLKQSGGSATLGARQLAAAELLMQRMPKLEGLEALLREHPTDEVRRWWWARARQVGDLTTKVVHGVELVLVRGGRFPMGSPTRETGRDDDEGPQHEVDLNGFWLARTPVTNAQYREYMKANTTAKEPKHWGDRRYNQDEQPVVGVSWHEAQAYCTWAGLQLPTEAQWEYACRAGTTARYCSGNTEKDLKKVGWYVGNSDGRLHGVRELEPNGWGLYDMHGNVFEWCEDAYGDYSTSPRAGDGLRHQPVGDAARVMRGGRFDGEVHHARSAFRNFRLPDNRWDYVGFRPAQGVPLGPTVGVDHRRRW